MDFRAVTTETYFSNYWDNIHETKLPQLSIFSTNELRSDYFLKVVAIFKNICLTLVRLKDFQSENEHVTFVNLMTAVKKNLA